MAFFGEEKYIRDAAPYLGLGIQLALVVVVFYFIGKLIDDKFETTPWFSLTGSVIGSVGGFISFYKKINALSEKENNKYK